MKRDFDSPTKGHPLTSSSFADRISVKNICRLLFLGVLLAILSCSSLAQTPLPFAVVNPHNKKWSAEEAQRIYLAACNLVARRIRPERPPKLRPRFLLVLGAGENEIVRNGAEAEVHLQSWNSARFAEAAVIMAAREVLQGEEVAGIAHDVLRSAGATVSVNELKQGR